MFIAFAAYSGSMAMHSVSSVGPARVLGGAIFPVGLMLVIFLGAELFTGNCLVAMAVFDKKVKVRDMFINLGVVFISNLVGALFIVILCSFPQQETGSAAALAAPECCRLHEL